MIAFPRMRIFRLSERGHGVSCDEEGLFIGPVPLLTRNKPGDGRDIWSVRPDSELNQELATHYNLPINVSLKLGGIMAVARALNRGNLVLAKIAAVQLQFPDSSLLATEIGAPEHRMRVAAELYWSGLLKIDDDWESKHPRTGTKPNPGWFANVPKEPKPPTKSRWPIPEVNRKARDLILDAEKAAAKTGRFLVDGVPVLDAIDAFVQAMEPTELNQGEDLLIAQMKANFAPPKTLEELQETPTENLLGYERHHIVEQNPANLEKDGEEVLAFDESENLEKFGREKLDDPSNIVWVPRLKHEKITADYNRTDERDPQERRRRVVVNEMDFDRQREEGLQKLREYKVLK
jgi:hypothetical protein